jgi:hypothetical protein
MEAASSLIGLLVGIYALKAYKVVRDRSLLFLNTSFLLLGSSMLTRVAVLFYLVAIRRLQLGVGPRIFLLEVANAIYLLSTMVAYLMLALAYAGRDWMKASISAQIAFIFETSPFTLVINLIDAFFLTYIYINLISSYIVERNRLQLFVLLGLILILSSHVVPLLAAIYTPLILLETSLRLIGFLSIFMALATVEFRR